MNKIKYFFLLFLMQIGFVSIVSAQKDSLEVSLLTCSPGQEVYELYGHTAIRCHFSGTGEDWVFNYGVFDFSEPHFISRFVRGECYYRIGAVPFDLFCQEYEKRGSTVYQQVLNLTDEEKQALWNILIVNMKPENQKYLYNFFYDNCTTRARDRIEDAIEGKVVYKKSDSVRTFRNIVHQYTKNYPWAELGNDICLGCAADKPITEREEMFAPLYMMDYADGAVIQNADGSVRPFVKSTDEVVKGHAQVIRKEFVLTPAQAVWSVVCLVFLLVVIEQLRGKIFWGIDVVIMTLVGIIGIVVAFLFFFSIHPTVDTNWQILVFNPFPLVMMPWVVYCAVKKRKTRFHMLNIAYLTLFIIFSAFIPQDFTPVVVPLALCLLLHSCSYWLIYRKEREKRHA